MQSEKEKALEAIRSLIAYYTSDFHEGNGYTGKQQLMYLTRPQTEIALRYGIPIGVRDKYGMHMGTPFGKPFRYVTVRNLDMLDKWLSFASTESLATIHAELPRGIQKKMREYIFQIIEIESPECLPPPKPVAPILGAHGNTFNLLCIVNRALRQAGQMEQAEEMWRRVLDNGDNFKAISIMEEYVEFDEAYLPAAMHFDRSLRGDLRV